MKKIIKIMMAVLMIFCLCGCNDKDGNEKPNETIYDIIGKKFYNQNTAGAKERGNLTIYKEEDFELYEYIDGELVLIRGDYKQRGNEYDLYPYNSKDVPSKIVFKALSEEEVVLDTALKTSKALDSYVVKEKLKADENADPVVYYYMNPSANQFGNSHLDLYKDGRFELTEVQGMGAVLIEGRYGREGNVYMFSNFDSFTDLNGETVHNFEFFVLDEDTLELNEDLSAVRKGSFFSRTGILPEGMEINNEPVLLMSFVHTSMSDVLDDYLPRVNMNSDGTFEFIENVYVGMAKISGHYEPIYKGYIFYVDENSSLQGFSGQDVKEFEIIHDDANGGYMITRGLCMTSPNDSFDFYYYGE